MPYFGCFLIFLSDIKFWKIQISGEEHGIHFKADLRYACTWVFTHSKKGIAGERRPKDRVTLMHKGLMSKSF